MISLLFAAACLALAEPGIAQAGWAAELLARIPPAASAAFLLPRGKIGADEFDKSLARLKAAPADAWSRVLADLPNAKAVDPNASAAILVHEPGEPVGTVFRVRLVKTAAGADPLAGPKRTADGDRVVYPISDARALHGKALPGGWWAIGAGKADLDWFLKAGGADKPSAERVAAVSAAAAVLRFAASSQKDRPGVSRLTAGMELPGGAIASTVLETVERVFGPLESATACLGTSEAGIRSQLFLDFPAGGDAAQWLAGAGEPRADPLAGIALGEPAAILSIQLSPEIARAGTAVSVRRMIELLRGRGGVFEDGFDKRLADAFGQVVGAAGAVGVVIGLPAAKDSTVGLRGALTPTAGGDARKALADAVAPVNALFKAVLRPPIPPVVLKRTEAASKIGDKPVDVLELIADGDSVPAAVARSIVESIVGPQGLALHMGPTADGRLAFALGCDRPLLERTLSGQPIPPPPALVAKAAGTLPEKRHLTLLVSPGRLMFLGRRIRENALQLPAWKPTGFVAVGGRFSERSIRLDVDVPWEEAEAIGEWLRSRPAP